LAGRVIRAWELSRACVLRGALWGWRVSALASGRPRNSADLARRDGHDQDERQGWISPTEGAEDQQFAAPPDRACG